MIPSGKARVLLAAARPPVIKRTIEISEQAAHLAVRQRQLLLKRDGKIVASFPCEDVGMLLVDHPAVTYSHRALTELVENGAAVLFCGADHLPAGILLPLANHSQVVWRVDEQLAAAKPLKKQLWKQLVQAKIRGQAGNLPGDCPAREKLLKLAGSVRSGDTSNVEAWAAKVYWQHWLPGGPFRRDTNGRGLNALLNYGYAVMRAAVARALVAAGLLPVLGLHHSNRSNAFCLADDLMEPLRPLVDAKVRWLDEHEWREVSRPTKAHLLRMLGESVETAGQSGPLMVALHHMAASLVHCYQGESRKLEIPRPCKSADTVACGF